MRIAALFFFCASVTLLAAPDEELLPAPAEELLPGLSNRHERLGLGRSRFVAPEGFTVEEAASGALTGSLIRLTFDSRGRPILAAEQGGIRIAIDAGGDGRFESLKEFCSEVKGAQGMCFVGEGDLLVQATGTQGAGLYRLVDTDGDDRADRIELIAKSTGEMTEHGPHAIERGPDGALYLLYGNYAHPAAEIDPGSPSRGLREDHLLPRFLDPRGHSTEITVPGGTILQLDLEKRRWSQIAGGLRNAYGFAFDPSGEIFTCDSDMEWDVGLPWYRPVRLLHVAPGADFGWRTGSGEIMDDCLDTLPGIEDWGRGSPVGMVFYDHHAYPEKFRGALFTGDWSRGRIRVTFLRRAGATYSGESADFIAGEPLNVTDLGVGPAGCLYFTTGGRSTSGGLYRVRYTGKPAAATPGAAPGIGVGAVLDQPMPQSAWGRLRLSEAKARMGVAWERELESALLDEGGSATRRLKALGALDSLGPWPSAALLERLSRSGQSEMRAAAAASLGRLPLAASGETLARLLKDAEPLVQRRACEGLVRVGIGEGALGKSVKGSLLNLLDSRDRFVRYAARLALERLERSTWAGDVLRDAVERRPRGSMEGLLALLDTQKTPAHSDEIFEKLEAYSRAPMPEETLLSLLRVLELALVRDLNRPARREFSETVGVRLLRLFPAKDARVNRELQILLAYLKPPGTIAAMLGALSPEKPQEEQIHTVYCLRAIDRDWTAAERAKIVEWFDRGRELRGAVSMEGYLYFLWQAVLEHLPPAEREAAEARRERAIDERTKKNAALLAGAEPERTPWRADAAQMSFEELALYLETDPTSYHGNAERGRWVFQRAKCANCHVFGKEGRGGGPDLSTVVGRRREILESIMFPSKVISDQYTTINVELKKGETVVGLLVAESARSLTLITATGERIDLRKNDIARHAPSKVSIMPEGLIDTMNLHDLVDLFAVLESGG